MTTVNATGRVERQIESLLRAGKSAQWISAQMGEPMNVVLAVLQTMRRQRNDRPTDPRGADPSTIPSARSETTMTNPGLDLFTRAAAIDGGGKRLDRAVEKAHAALDALRVIVVEHERTAVARAKIAQLEAELAAAKAQLRAGAEAKPAAGESRVIREWAAANGVECPTVGIVPKRVVEAYRQANAA